MLVRTTLGNRLHAIQVLRKVLNLQQPSAVIYRTVHQSIRDGMSSEEVDEVIDQIIQWVVDGNRLEMWVTAKALVVFATAKKPTIGERFGQWLKSFTQLLDDIEPKPKPFKYTGVLLNESLRSIDPFSDTLTSEQAKAIGIEAKLNMAYFYEVFMDGAPDYTHRNGNLRSHG